MENKLKIAIIPSGHLRLVPYGYNLIDQLARKLDFDYKIFNVYWDESSDWSGQVPHGQTREILKKDNVVSIEKNQQEYMAFLRKLFEEHGSIPRNQNLIPNNYYKLTDNDFARFLGQIIGFLLSIDQWKNEIETYDYIIRCRWDIPPDWRPIKRWITGTENLDKTFMTNIVYVREGELEIGGDLIYGKTSDWLECVNPLGHAIEKLKQGCKMRFDAIKNNPVYSISETSFSLDSGWFNSHFLWGTLFKNSRYKIISDGQARNIKNENLPLYPDDVELYDIFLDIRELDIDENDSDNRDEPGVGSGDSPPIDK